MRSSLRPFDPRVATGLLGGVLVVSQLLSAARAETTHHATSSPASAVPCSDAGVWLVNTRGAPCPYRPQRRLRIYHLSHDGRWQSASMDEFFESTPDQRFDWIFVHGNRIERNDAARIGLQLAGRFGATHLPVRFVIWSWPSERIPGTVRDVREKARRADDEAAHLTQWLARYTSSRHVTLIGYSYGARIITGALDRLARTAAGASLPDRPASNSLQTRAVLIAAAMPNDWLLPNHRHGQAATQAEHILSLYNCHDPVLRRFRVVRSPGSPLALGAVGVASTQLGPAASKLRQRNVTCQAGRSHDLDAYLSSSILNEVRAFCLWDEQRP